MALNDLQKVRVEVGDVDPAFPILPDSTYIYLLEKNYNSIARSSMDAARIVLMHLAMRSDDTTVDIFSIKGSKAAESYRQALILYIKDPNNNPMYQNCQAWFGGVSVSQMQSNDSNLDNNIVQQPSVSYDTTPTGYFTF